MPADGGARAQGHPDAHGDERSAARLVCRRLRGGRAALEQDLRAPRHVGSAAAAGSQVQSRHRHVLVAALRSRPARRCRTKSGTRRKHEWLPGAADREYLLSIMAAPGLRAGQVRQLHRAAAARHQPAAGQFRVRADGGVRNC